MGKFCEVYGNTIRNRVLEYALETQDVDFDVTGMIKEISISKPKGYETIRYFIYMGVIKKTRIVGKTQLYMLDKDNIHTKIFIKNFMECLKMVIDEHDK